MFEDIGSIIPVGARTPATERRHDEVRHGCGTDCDCRSGPTKFGALEALVAHLADSGCRVAVDVFEPSDAPGAGPNFHPDESPLCLLNIPFRDIAIRPPAFSRAGSFARWYARHTGKQADPDSFPPRADLGRYLQARLQDLLDISNGTITIVPNKVARIERSDAGWRVHAGDQPRAPYDEVLLTPASPRPRPTTSWPNGRTMPATRRGNWRRPIRRRDWRNARKIGQAAPWPSVVWGCRPLTCCGC